MARFLLLCIASFFICWFISSCNSSSSNNPQSPNTPNYSLVGNWRHIVYANQQSGSSTYAVYVNPADSTYFRIDSSGHYIYESKSNNVVVMRMIGHGYYNPPLLRLFVDSIMQQTPGTDTIHAGDTLDQNIALSLNNGLIISQGRARTTNLLQYEALLRMGSDIKFAGVTADFGTGNVQYVSRSGVTVRCLLNETSAVQTTISNEWGFFAFVGVSPGLYRVQGTINGEAYDGFVNTVNSAGCYPMLLLR